MNILSILQPVNAVGAIAAIMIGSAWLKKHLKHYAG